MNYKLLLFASMAMSLMACSGNAKSATNDAEGESVMESTDSVSPLVINDALCLDVRGDVSSLEETVKENLYEATTVYVFDENGHLTSSYVRDSGIINDDIKVTRDDKGVPTKLTMKVEDDMGEPEDYTITFTYDEANRLIQEQHDNYDASWTTIYTRDSDGKVTEMTVKDPFGGSETLTFSYPENSIDDHGNWTIRTTGNSTVSRKITYK